jgi:tRNA pseudouridine55 synthase
MKSVDNGISGVINIYKEKGFTSHDVVNIVRKSLGRIKTGHTGTLDPDAEGVLPICVGKATKLADYIQADVKQYKAVLRLGITTTTEDTSGEVLTQSNITSSDADVESAISSFVGEYNQMPPMYSAIKVNGKKLYELAREGKEVERKTRLIKIYDITDVKKVSDTDWEFLVLCSKGTYIRTLCSDIGKKTRLRRLYG